MVTLTRLLAISMVASSRSGFESRERTVEPELDSSSSSHCCSVSEKNAISLPETNPEITRHPSASSKAMIPATLSPVAVMSGATFKRILLNGSMAGKGSMSKTIKIS